MTGNINGSGTRKDQKESTGANRHEKPEGKLGGPGKNQIVGLGEDAKQAGQGRRNVTRKPNPVQKLEAFLFTRKKGKKEKGGRLNTGERENTAKTKVEHDLRGKRR